MNFEDYEEYISEAEVLAGFGRWVYDPKTRKLIYINEGFANIYGVETVNIETFTATPDHQVGNIYSDDVAKATAAYKAVCEDGVSYSIEFRFIHQDGGIRWLQETGAAIRNEAGEITAAVGTALDITDRKNLEMSLKESEGLYREIFEESPVTLWVEDWSKVKRVIDQLTTEGVEDWRTYLADHRDFVIDAYDMVDLIDTSKGSLKLYGTKSLEENIAISQGGDAHPEELDAFIETLLGFIEGNWEFDLESMDFTKNGSSILVHTKGVIPTSSRHDWSRVTYTMEDITDRKNAEQALAEAHQINETIFSGSPVGIAMYDSTGQPTRRSARLSGPHATRSWRRTSIILPHGRKSAFTIKCSNACHRRIG